MRASAADSGQTWSCSRTRSTMYAASSLTQWSSEEPRALPGLAHAVMHLLAAASRLAVRHRRTIRRPSSRQPILLTSTPIAINPVLHRRDRHAATPRPAGASSPPRDTSQPAQRAASRAPTLVQHPGPPRRGSLEGPRASAVTRMPPQPFTTYVGTSASRGASTARSRPSSPPSARPARRAPLRSRRCAHARRAARARPCQAPLGSPRSA
jgi:hypothetical protein